MKTKFIVLLFIGLIISVFTGCSTGYVSQDNGSQYNGSQNYQDNSNYSDYNDNDLNQYGQWVNYNQYGRVWHPAVGNNWQPFSDGHWAYNGNDWVWVSNEPYGWIVYHHGSWENTPEYGWIWIAARDPWSPACVQWVYYGDEVCWAPRRANNRNWSEPWENNNVRPWMAVRMENFHRENVSNYRDNTVTRVNNVNQVQIERRSPPVNVVQHYVKDPIRTERIERNPVRNNTPPVKTNTPPVRNQTSPGRNDAPPVRITTPPVKNQVPTDNIGTPQVRPNTPPVRNETSPGRNDAPPVKNDTHPTRNYNPPVKTNTPLHTRTNTPTGRKNTPPVKTNTPPVKTNTPPVKTNTPPVKAGKDHPKVDVAPKENTIQKTDEKKNNDKNPESK